MEDPNPQTEPLKQDATGLENPATNQESNGAATDDKVVLSKEDHQNLIAQRDRANEALRTSQSSSSEQDSFLLELVKERELKEVLADPEFTKKYPDIELQDLMYAESPDEIESIAKKQQRRFEDVAQKKLEIVQRGNIAPELSEQEVSDKVNSLRNSGRTDAFEQMASLRGYK